MSHHGTIRRYTLIIEKLGRKQYPSFREIKDYLIDNGFEVSDRTIQRDIEQIRFEFGIEIMYDRLNKGYFIDEEKSTNVEAFLSFLEIGHTAFLLTESLKESKDTLDYISFESVGDLKGIENLKPLLFAIKNKRKISFVHENFSTGRMKKFTLNPYLLREYLNRWYIVGIRVDKKELRTFGIERISNLEVKEENFKPDPKISPSKLFDNIIGVNCSDDDVEEVELSFTPLQGKYVKSLPWHRSQKILKDDDMELIIRLRVIPNYEFTQRILMHGNAVRVLKPKWLADHIKNILRETLANYS